MQDVNYIIAKVKEVQSIALVVIGGGLKNDNGVWRTTNLDEGDTYGPLGDRLRVEATASLFRELIAHAKTVSIFAVGGVGRSKELEHPAVSSVYKKELTELGVPDNAITIEEKSASTFQQLQAAADYILHFSNVDMMLISNRYHLPRIEAMIRYAKPLSVLLDRLQTKQLSLVSAEDILLKNNPEEWRDTIEEAYKSKSMKKRVALEEQSVAQIQSGTYVFK